MTLPSLQDILAAQRRIAPFVVHTPLLRHDALDAALQARAFVKPECLQRFGAFKARGAFNALAAMSPQQRRNGVVAFSSGNHAQAVAGAARSFKVPATIVMPKDAPTAKIENTKALGAEVILYDRLTEDREAIGKAIAAEHNAPIVPPFDNANVIAGQGTAGLEIGNDLSTLGLAADVAYVCASGGGLASGISLALRAFNPAIQIYAVEPVGHERIARSLAAGERVSNAPGVRSICDALMADKMGALPWALAQSIGMGAVSVNDDQVREAMRFAFAHLRIVLEPGGAAALAAALFSGIDVTGKTVAIVASGGNVDPGVFADVLAHR
jgi:threonine dehydratase